MLGQIHITGSIAANYNQLLSRVIQGGGGGELLYINKLIVTSLNHKRELCSFTLCNLALVIICSFLLFLNIYIKTKIEPFKYIFECKSKRILSLNGNRSSSIKTFDANNRFMSILFILYYM